MNSLSLLSSRVDKVIGSTPTTPATPTSEAFKDIRHQQLTGPEALLRPERSESTGSTSPLSLSTAVGDLAVSEVDAISSAVAGGDEVEKMPSNPSPVMGIYLQVAESWLITYRWMVMMISFCVWWIVSCFYDEKGQFCAYLPAYTMLLVISNTAYPRTQQSAPPPPPVLPPPKKRRLSTTIKNAFKGKLADEEDSAVSSSTAVTHHTRARSVNSSDSGGEDITPRRSIRIRLFNENSEKLSKPSKAASIKSPTSPSNSSTLRLTKYPRNTGPPRPLLANNPSQKTLILDLDETLIHSLSKGGRLTSGHMVEVKLEGQHPILYYVHKRPYCEEFLRKVYKWYNLVIFTASVQEYADPVIDWLEQDRKYFKGRYYRQHCTNRNGTYIKDISSIEPDLSKVIILDNSPMSYMFHEDNAIPIEGWINDPTDIDLLNLIPLLHALHYVTDVRALLALRMGEAFP